MFYIAIRADGGQAVGMGHIMRCLVLAEELKKAGARVYFISRYAMGIEKIKMSGFEAFMIKIDTDATLNGDLMVFDYGNECELETDLRQTKQIIDQQGCDLLIVDKYNLNAGYFDQIKSWGLKSAFIDDLNLFLCPAEFIINGNINAANLGYKKSSGTQKLLLGSRYIFLRSEFRGLGLRKSKNFIADGGIPEVMITTGGADPFNCTEKIIKILLQNNNTANFRLNVIVGPGFVFAKQLQDLANVHTNIRLYIKHDCISEVMLRSDLAVSSGGSTLYELCCCGTPTLAFMMADNQKGIAEALEKKGCIHLLGWHTELENSNLAEMVYEMINNADIRKQYCQRMQALVDGKGASLVATELLSYI